MGHVINPSSQRLGYSVFWNSIWSISNTSTSYSFMATEDNLLNNFFRKVFFTITQKIFKKGIIFINFKMIRFINNLNLLVYFKLEPFDSLFFKLLDQLKNFKKFAKIRKLKRRQRRNNKILSLKKRGFLEPFILPRHTSSFSDKLMPARELFFSKFKDIKLTTLSLKRQTNKIKSRRRPVSRNQDNQKFISTSTNWLKFNPDGTGADKTSYIWNCFTNFFQIKRAIYVDDTPKNFIRDEFLNFLIAYIINQSWLKNIQNFFISALRNFFNSRNFFFDVIFIVLPLTAITANFIATYVAIKLLNGFPLRRLINALLWQMRRLYYEGSIGGFKISCSGRFERRGRATHTWKKVGRIPRSTVSVNVDYAITLPVLINSICAIKVWVTNIYSTQKILII